MKIAITFEQREKLGHELRSYLQGHWGVDAALHVAVTQNSIFSLLEQWVLEEFVRAWVPLTSSIRDLDEPLTEQHITQFLANFIVLEETHQP